MNQDNTVIEDLAQSSLSSGSIPAVFPPQHLNGHLFMDGGTVWNANLSSAVQQCLEVVDDVADIIVDVAICGYNPKPDAEAQQDTIGNYMAARAIKSYYSNTSSLV